MSFQLVIAEKPSVARSIAAVIGADEKQNGYWQGGGYLVSWCIGHLVSFAEAGQLSGFIGGILLFVVRGDSGCSIQRTAAQESRELVRLHVHAAHQLNDLQVFLFSLCSFQFFQLLLVFRDFFFEPFNIALNAGKSFCHTKSFLASR